MNEIIINPFPYPGYVVGLRVTASEGGGGVMREREPSCGGGNETVSERDTE